MSGFNKGDEVQLKSGGPKMVIAELGDYGPLGPEDGAKCVWFDKATKKEDVFDVAVLKKYSSAPIGVRLSRG